MSSSVSAMELLRKQDVGLLLVLRKNLGPFPDEFVGALIEKITPHEYWAEAPESETVLLLLEIAVVVFDRYEGDCLPLMAAIAAYLNPRVPWSNAAYAAAAQSLSWAKCQHLQTRFLAYLQPRMVLSKEPPLKAVSRYSKIKGLRPALGFSPSTASQDEERRAWKNSPNVLALSQVRLLMRSGQYGTLLSFVLQVFDDSDPVVKSQACYLLLDFMDADSAYLVKSGLVPLFREALKICLTYLPQLTPPDISLRLMQGAYPCIIRMIELEADVSTYTAYVEVIVTHLLGLISHILRSKEKETNELLAFFLSEISSVIEQKVGVAIVICLSRLIFTVNQLITDPLLIDFDAGALVVDNALKVQKSVLKVFETADAEGLALALEHKYDLLACWAVLAKRISSFSVGTEESRRLLQENLALLHKVSLNVPNAAAEFEEDKAVMLEKVPGMVQLLRAEL